MNGKKVSFDTLRTLAYTSISATYAAIGSALTVNPRIMCITNTTNVDVVVSDDGGNTAGKLFIPAGGFKLFDFSTNMKQSDSDNYVMAVGVTMYAKSAGAPTSGAVYLEYIY